MKYFPDILVTLSLYPSGLVFGFYFYYYELGFMKVDTIQKLWPIIVGVGCCSVVALFTVVKKLHQNTYAFDNFYFLTVGCLCYTLCGLFLLRNLIDVAVYFGFAGHGITHIPALVYIGVRSPKNGKRTIRFAILYTFYFLGITTSTSILASDLLEKTTENSTSVVGWILIGSNMFLIICFIFNEILQSTRNYNYKTSLDSVWNYHNNQNCLFITRRKILEQFEHSINASVKPNFYITSNRRPRITYVSLLLRACNSMMFCNVMLTFSSMAMTHYMHDYGIVVSLFMIAATLGVIIGIIFLLCISRRTVFIIFCVLKIAILIVIVSIFKVTQPFYCVIYFLLYYITIGAFYSIPSVVLFEVASFKYTEIIVALGYFCELLATGFVRYICSFRSMFDETTFLFTVGIIYTIISSVSVILVQLYLPESKPLITMRNELIGIRQVKKEPNSSYQTTSAQQTRTSQLALEQSPQSGQNQLCPYHQAHPHVSFSNWNTLYSYGPKSIYAIPRVSYAGLKNMAKDSPSNLQEDLT